MEHFIVQTLVSHGYLAVFLLMVLQAACIPVPSEATMALGGAAASTAFVTATLGAGHHPLSLIGVIAVGVAGDLTGSWISYTVGRIGGRPLVERFGRRVFLREHELARAERWFADHGESAVFVSKLLPVARSFISLPAGVGEMSPVRFSAFVVLGTLPFATAIALLGYRFGDVVVRDLRPVAYAVAGLLVLLLAWWLVRRARRAKRADPAATDPTTASAP
jgi:membrane protein DedA with SNARE-associated domain